MPDKYAFNFLGEKRYCIECNEGGFAWDWSEDRRKEHFLDCSGANLVIQEEIFSSSLGGIRLGNCRICGNEFSQPRKRGRPRINCYICKPEE